jgi:hypothetical protein
MPWQALSSSGAQRGAAAPKKGTSVRSLRGCTKSYVSACALQKREAAAKKTGTSVRSLEGGSRKSYVGGSGSGRSASSVHQIRAGMVWRVWTGLDGSGHVRQFHLLRAGLVWPVWTARPEIPQSLHQHRAGLVWRDRKKLRLGRQSPETGRSGPKKQGRQ